MGIGPSSKETTLHHFRDPVVERIARDKSIDFLGVLLQGTPENYGHKQFIANRSGVYAEMMRADGVIVQIDSWGNSHVDFTSVIQALGERNIPTVGLSFVGKQAAFVVTNRYMDAIIDLNKTALGTETCMVGQNTANEMDALKALAILKNRMRKKYPEHARHDSDEKKEILLRRLLVDVFRINDVCLSDRMAIADETLLLSTREIAEIVGRYPEVEDIKLSVIRPDTENFFINSVLDFSPIAVKVHGRAGEGLTNLLTGVSVMITGVEKGGFQPANIGSSEGMFEQRVMRDRRGTPGSDETIIHFDVLLAEGQGRTRNGVMAAHGATDALVQDVRGELKKMNGTLACDKQDFYDIARPGAFRVLVIKLISGLGCMYDTALFPHDPAGYAGSRSIMELSNNIQVPLTPNEYRDGMIHSLC